MVLFAQCPQAARLPKGAGRRPVNVCVFVHCTVIFNTVCDHSACVATGVQRPPMPKCLFYRAGDLHRTLSRQWGTHKHTHTQTHIHTESCKRHSSLAAGHGSLILLSHCVLGQRWLFAVLSPSLS